MRMYLRPGRQVLLEALRSHKGNLSIKGESALATICVALASTLNATNHSVGRSRRAHGDSFGRRNRHLAVAQSDPLLERPARDLSVAKNCELQRTARSLTKQSSSSPTFQIVIEVRRGRLQVDEHLRANRRQSLRCDPARLTWQLSADAPAKHTL